MTDKENNGMPSKSNTGKSVRVTQTDQRSVIKEGREGWQPTAPANTIKGQPPTGTVNKPSTSKKDK